MNLDLINQPYLEIFPGDQSGNKQQRQTPKMDFSTIEIMGFEQAELLSFNADLAAEIGLGILENVEDKDFLNASKLPHNVKKVILTPTYQTIRKKH